MYIITDVLTRLYQVTPFTASYIPLVMKNMAAYRHIYCKPICCLMFDIHTKKYIFIHDSLALHVLSKTS